MNKKEILIFMTIRNIGKKEKLFKEVYESASKISKNFYIVNHGSDDNTIEILNNLSNKFETNNVLKNEEFIGTMDYMKGKHYKLIKEKYNGIFIFALDWDEVISEDLIKEINNLDFKNDIYLIKRDSYFLDTIFKHNELMPIFFKLGSVEINNFNQVHNLYKIISDDKKILNGKLLHYSYDSLEDFINKGLYYSKIEAEEMVNNHIYITNFKIFFKIIVEGSYYFLNFLIIEKNITSLNGIFFSFYNYIRVFTKYLYYIYLRK